MCLTLTEEQTVVKTATEDITTYKVVKRNNYTGHWYTFYMKTIIKNGILRGVDKIFDEEYEDLKDCIRRYEYRIVVEDGAIHSFLNLEALKELINKLQRTYVNGELLENNQEIDDDVIVSIIILKTIIPKGTQYISNGKEVASQRLKIDTSNILYLDDFMK